MQFLGRIGGIDGVQQTQLAAGIALEIQLNWQPTVDKTFQLELMMLGPVGRGRE